MPLVSISSLVIAVFLLGAQLVLRQAFYGERGLIIFWRMTRIVFGVLLAGKFFLAGYFTYQQYFIWLSHPLSRLLLPPSQSWQYFISYSLTNFFLAPAITGLVALVILLAIKLVNWKFGGRFFELAEPYLAGLAVLLVGSQAWIYYLAAVLLSALLLATYYSLRFRGRAKRISLYYFWLPVAVLVILIVKILSL